MASATACPFCGISLRDSPAPLGAVASVLLGLTLFGCGDDTASEGGASQTMSSTAGTESSTDTGTVSVTDTDSQGASDYGGPSTLEDTGLPQTTVETGASESESGSSDDTSGSDTTAAAESSESGESSGSSGTDTGASSSESGSAEGADYGAAPPKN